MKPRIPAKTLGSAAPEFFSPDVANARRFYLDLNPPKNRPLVIVCGGMERCTKNYAVHRQTFPFYSIEYVARGHGEVKLKSRSNSLQPGCLFSYGPGIPHHIRGEAADPLVKYFVDFTGTRATRLLKSCGLPPGSVSEVFPTNSLQPLFDELIHVGLQVRRGSAALCAHLLECLVLRISGAHAPLAGTETLAFTTYQQCRQHIEQHCLRLRTLEQIAAERHINGAYLCRLFRRYDSQSPYQYLLRLKMNHAAECLQQHGTLVKQVAEECGFTDPFHFSRVFVSLFGVSPTGFREMR